MIETVKNKAPLTNDLVPSEFFLGQNYPNPFKDKTSIKYCLPEKTEVKLTLFNSKGKTVKEHLDKVQNAGTYEVILDSQDWPDGVYYYQLKAVDLKSSSRQLFNETKKMILMK